MSDLPHDNSAAVPHPEPEAPPRGGRDERGRFTRNNLGGPGNPFARRVAAFRSTLAAAVTEEMIAAVVAKLTEAALAGDLAAIKLFLAYTVGKPAPAVSPDTLDVEELRLYEQEQLPAQALNSIMTSPPPEFFLETARVTRPHLADQCRQRILDGIDAMDEADRQAAAIDGRDGEAEEPEVRGHPREAATEGGQPEHSRQARVATRKGGRPAPSGNGDNRGGRPTEQRQPGTGRDNPKGEGRDPRADPGTNGHARPL
jgi:hypothetical protein